MKRKHKFGNYASINYNHLRPPISCLDIKPKGKEVLEKTLNPVIPYKRHIFYAVEFESEEKTIINDVTKVIEFSPPIPPKWWDKSDTLRFIYEFDWDLNLICEVNKNKI